MEKSKLQKYLKKLKLKLEKLEAHLDANPIDQNSVAKKRALTNVFNSTIVKYKLELQKETPGMTFEEVLQTLE